MDINIVPLKCLHKAIGHAIGFGVGHGRKAWNPSQFLPEFDSSLAG